jgi:hypothetical protein
MMTIAVKNKLVLLGVFYKSTLTLSIAISALMATLSIFNIPGMLLVFGFCFLSAGTVISLLYKEMSKQHEYYFYYNMGLPKWSLILTCTIGNLLIGIILITLSAYAK